MSWNNIKISLFLITAILSSFLIANTWIQEDGEFFRWLVSSRKTFAKKIKIDTTIIDSEGIASILSHREFLDFQQTKSNLKENQNEKDSKANRLYLVVHFTPVPFRQPRGMLAVTINSKYTTKMNVGYLLRPNHPSYFCIVPIPADVVLAENSPESPITHYKWEHLYLLWP